MFHAVGLLESAHSLTQICPSPTGTRGKDMDDSLKAKLDEARNRMNSQQAGINANRKHDDPAMREWARGNSVQRMQNGLSSGTR